MSGGMFLLVSRVFLEGVWVREEVRFHCKRNVRLDTRKEKLNVELPLSIYLGVSRYSLGYGCLDTFRYSLISSF